MRFKLHEFAWIEFQVLRMTPALVYIPFPPLLRKIVACLGFPKAKYYFIDRATNSVAVVVSTQTPPKAFTYNGGPANTIMESRENAARQAIVHLMREYNIFVDDYTALKRDEEDRCAELYKLKSTELLRIERGQSKIHLHESILGRTCGYSRVVQADFISILHAIFRKFPTQATPIEILERCPRNVMAWITITPSGNNSAPKSIFGEGRTNSVLAKENLAKKVIEYLKLLYNFDIVDANYNPPKSKFHSILCALERESYLAIKERVLGIAETVQPSVLLVEQDCITPRGPLYRIPDQASPPLPPKKRKFDLEFGSSSTLPLDADIAPSEVPDGDAPAV